MSPFAFSDFPKMRGTVLSPTLLKYDTLFAHPDLWHRAISISIDKG